MLEGEWLYVVFAAVAIALVVRARRSNQRLTTLALKLAFAFYVSRVIALTFFPFPLDAVIGSTSDEFFVEAFDLNNNFVPLRTIRRTWGSTFARQVLGNLILLFPLGVFAPLVAPQFRQWRRAALLPVVAAAMIEFAQLGLSFAIGSSYRSFDVDDLWLNTLGGIPGSVAGVYLSRTSVFIRLA